MTYSRTSVITTAGISAALCLGGQMFFAALFAYGPEGWWRRQPGFLAHQAVALPLMIYLAVTGSVAWFSPELAHLDRTFVERVHGANPTGEHMAGVILGAQLAWDIPTNLAIPSLYSRLMMAHHVGMSLVAALSLSPYMQYYCAFFGGVIEISGVPLAIVDVFHPSHFGELAERHPGLGMLNMACRVSFAVSFLLVRGLYFPFVVVLRVLPDLAAVLRAGEPPAAPLFSIAVALGMTALQLHWGSLIVKQLLKMVRGKPKPLASHDSLQGDGAALCESSAPDSAMDSARKALLSAFDV